MRSINKTRRRVLLVTLAAGALVAATGVTASASAPPDTTPGGSEAGAAGGLSIGGEGGSVAPNADITQGLNIYFIPKDTQNPYEVIADAGGATAMDELGGTQVISSGTEDTAAAQIPSIQAAIADQADAIVIAGNDPDALCPSIQQAQDAGIVVVAFDSDVDVRRPPVHQPGGDQQHRHRRGRLHGDVARRQGRGGDPLGRRHGDQPERLDRGDEDAVRQVPGHEARRRRLRQRRPGDVAHGAPGAALGTPGPRRHHLADHRGHLHGGAVPVDAPGDRRAADRSRPALADGPVRP